ncbi:hypothetical protein FKW77_006005 [Venturia effusa]|uniref:Uncharacterized protein n=1 Tax=Venturia effusa TaxID=50376 RepID=A0A517LCD2_9PEZI|nr:hypothetical protein FKW77_006005 [Venturia effusa]
MDQEEIDKSREKIYRDAETRTNYAGFLHDLNPGKCFEISEEPRLPIIVPNTMSLKKVDHGTGVYTHFGLTTAGFTTFHFMYGPQALTALGAGIPCDEAQGDRTGEAG